MNQETRDNLPYLGISEYGEQLVGNQEGFRLLRQAVDRLLDGDEESVKVEGNLEILSLELSTPEDQEPASSNVIGFSCILIVVIVFVVIFGFAAFGFIQVLENL